MPPVSLQYQTVLTSLVIHHIRTWFVLQQEFCQCSVSSKNDHYTMLWKLQMLKAWSKQKQCGYEKLKRALKTKLKSDLIKDLTLQKEMMTSQGMQKDGLRLAMITKIWYYCQRTTKSPNSAHCIFTKLVILALLLQWQKLDCDFWYVF